MFIDRLLYILMIINEKIREKIKSKETKFMYGKKI